MITLPLIVGAFGAGFFMFLAPCTLPIVPGYLAFISGVSTADLADPARRSLARRRVMGNAFAFVIGFSIIFIALGSSAGVIGAALGEWRYTLARLGGAIIILFGLSMLGILRIPTLSSEWHIGIPHFFTLGRWESSLLIGMLFALGWSPCIGPVLGTILLVASTKGAALAGATLLAVFSVGLAIPFLLTAFFIYKATTLFTRIGWLTTALMYMGGVFLLALGALMLAGRMDILITAGYDIFDFIGYERLLNYL